ncbi:hypothetical protein Q9Q49_01800 [Campylobacter upsaliensis]|nr:hypothetical protein [Campylobacter upsaliensis]MEB2803319.1 hypothetical protein [Campylobacter upsaliensis]MEB2811553.1 hypothetical protein [Campylobacter upsaliensis]MEB2816533.1 hypothetical protein [Campylobacter upsaliensis]MEB2822643.1 hypothetical protein [Campylobacter upsaliensis]
MSILDIGQIIFITIVVLISFVGMVYVIKNSR